MLIRILMLITFVLAALLILAGQWGLLRGRAPTDLGAPNGKLKPPSPSENSVSSQASLYPHHPMRTYAEIAPLAFTGDAALAWKKLEHALATLPRTSIISHTQTEQGQRYLYAQCTTLFFRFTDDVEFVMDETKQVIHLRSASRLGRKDFGTNRKRIEIIRAVFHSL